MSQQGTIKLEDETGSIIEVAAHDLYDFSSGPLLRVKTPNGVAGVGLKDPADADTNLRIQTQNGTKAINTVVPNWLAVVDRTYEHYGGWYKLREDMSATDTQYGDNYSQMTVKRIRWHPGHGMWVILVSDESGTQGVEAYKPDGTQVFEYHETVGDTVQFENASGMDIDNNDNVYYLRQVGTDVDVVKVSYTTSGSTSVDWTYTEVDAYPIDLKCSSSGDIVAGFMSSLQRIDTAGNNVWTNSNYGGTAGLTIAGDGAGVMSTRGRAVLKWSDGSFMYDGSDIVDDGGEEWGEFIAPDHDYMILSEDHYSDIWLYYRDRTNSVTYKTKVTADVNDFEAPLDLDAGGTARLKADKYGNKWVFASNETTHENPVVVYDPTLSNVLYVSNFTINDWVRGTSLKPGSFPAFESYWQ